MWFDPGDPSDTQTLYCDYAELPALEQRFCVYMTGGTIWARVNDATADNVAGTTTDVQMTGVSVGYGWNYLCVGVENVLNGGTGVNDIQVQASIASEQFPA